MTETAMSLIERLYALRGALLDIALAGDSDKQRSIAKTAIFDDNVAKGEADNARNQRFAESRTSIIEKKPEDETNEQAGFRSCA